MNNLGVEGNKLPFSTTFQVFKPYHSLPYAQDPSRSFAMLGLLDFEDGNELLSPKVGKQLLTHAAQQPRGAMALNTPRRKPETLQDLASCPSPKSH